MSTQSQSAENQVEQKQRIEDRLTPTPESTTGQAALAQTPNMPQSRKISPKLRLVVFLLNE